MQERLESGKIGDYQTYLDRLLEQGHTATDIANAAITLLREATTREGEFIAEDQQKEAFANERPRSNWKEDRKSDRGNDRSNRFEREERPERGERRERGAKPERNNSKGMSCLFMNLGKAQHIKPGYIAGMIYRECKIPDGSLGKITLFPKHTLIDVSQDIANDVLEGLRNATLRGRTFKIDHDRQK